MYSVLLKHTLDRFFVVHIFTHFLSVLIYIQQKKVDYKLEKFGIELYTRFFKSYQSSMRYLFALWIWVKVIK